MTRYLFLCGVGRSGTTIFRTSLGQHPQIYYNGHENNVVQDVLGVAEKNCTAPSRKVALAVSQEQYDASFRVLLNAIIWPDPELRARPTRMAAINPDADQLDYLRQVFDGAKVICLVRNGIEVITSRQRYTSFSQQAFETHCAVWNRIGGWLDWGDQHPEHFRLIRHEWFYDPSELQARMDDLYRWAALEHSPAPSESITGTLRHPTDGTVEIDSDQFAASNQSQKREYFQAKRQRYEAWTAQQRQMFEEHCGPLMGRLGYPIPWRQ